MALGLPTATLAIIPLLALAGKQMIQNMIFNEVEGHLISSLAGMGCKGARLAGLIAANADRLRPGGGLGGMAGAGGMGGGMPPGMPNMASGGTPGGGMPPGMPSMAGAGGMPGGAMPPGMPSMPAGMPQGMAMPSMPTGAGGVAPGAMPRGTVPGGMAMGGAPMGAMPMGGSGPVAMGQAPGDLQQAFAAAQARTGAGSTMTPEQMARAQEAMARMQRAMEHPLSRPETLAVFDELKDLGILTDSMHSEARDCILLAPAGSDRQLGQTGAVFKEVLLPQIRETKAKLANLTPEEQDSLAQGISDALRDASPGDRKAFAEGLGQGFFPKAVVDKVAR
jgi:hypothetical protein